MKILKDDILAVLETPVIEFQPKRKICPRCDNLCSHALIYCNKCGTEYVTVKNMTVRNFINRIKKHFAYQGDGFSFFCGCSYSYFLERKYKVHYMDAFRFITVEKQKEAKKLYLELNPNNS